MFLFLVNPALWEFDGAWGFAPGIFLWSSAARYGVVSMETFWFEAVCTNHIAWNATRLCESTWETTAQKERAPQKIAAMIQELTRRQGERRGGLTRVIRRYVRPQHRRGAEEALRLLEARGSYRLATRVMRCAAKRGEVSALTGRS
jgi:hypothetical protein